MKIDPQKALRTMAAAGCVFLGSSAVLAQNEQSNDEQRDRQETRDNNRDDRQDRREARRDDRQTRDARNEDDRNSSNRSSEPWENRSRDDSRQASNDRDAERPGLGVSFANEDARPVIRQVHPGSPAEQMGLRQGDRITQVNGEEVNTAKDVIAEVRKSEPGDDIEIEVTRDGDDRSFEGELETRREALVLRGDRNRQRDSNSTAWNSDRSERRSYSVRGGDYAGDNYSSNNSSNRDAQGEYGRSNRGQQDAHRQLDSLERQVQQLHREIDQLRRSLGDSNSNRSSERQAGYNEYGSDRNEEVRTSFSYEGGQAPEDGFGSRSSNRGSTNQSGYRGQESDQENSPGGVVGGARTRPESDWIDNR